MADIVLKDRNGNGVSYEGVTALRLNTSDGGTQIFSAGEAVEGIEIALDFSNGDQPITAPEGTLVKSAVIKKPETLLPENIAKDVDIAGVVGTLESGGGGGNTSVVAEEEWLDDVCFWDYDGTLLCNIPLTSVGGLAELPTPPEHEGLVFVGWNYTLEQIQTTEYPLDIGAVYIPSDGNTHLKLVITNSSYLAVPMCFSQTVDSGVSIDWGDGEVTTVSGTGAISTTHTYSAIGTYEIVISVADGCTMTLGGGTTSTTFIGANTGTYQKYLTECYIGNNVQLGIAAFFSSQNLAVCTIPSSVTAIPKQLFYYAYRLLCLIVPSGITSMGAYAAVYAGSASYINMSVVSLPESLTTIDNSVFQYIAVKRICIPKQITQIPDYAFQNLYLAKRAFMSDNVTKFGASMFRGWFSIEKVSLPKSLTTIGHNCLYMCYNLKELSLPHGLVSIGSNFLSNAYNLFDLYIPATVTSIGADFMRNYPGVNRIIFAGATTLSAKINSPDSIKEIIYLSNTVPTVLAAQTDYADIYVPDEAYTAYYNAHSSSYRRKVHPLSEYKGVLPNN